MNAVDVNQGDVVDTVRVWIDDHHLVPAKGCKLGVPNLMDFSVGKPQFERLKRLADEPLADGFGVHCLIL